MNDEYYERWQKLHEEVSKLMALLQADECGLMSWHQILFDRLAKIDLRLEDLGYRFVETTK